MQDWLQQEVLRRLIDQTQCLLKEQADALLVIPDGLCLSEQALNAIPGVRHWTVLEASHIIQQTPQPSYDMIVWLLLPHDLEEQALIWQQLACLAKDAALLFFAAWSVDTWREWRDQLHDWPFQDMHNMGDGLAQAGWSEAVMSSQSFQLTYHDSKSLQCDAAVIGLEPCLQPVISADNPLVLSYEVAFGHAVFSAEARARQWGEYSIPLDQLRR